MNDIARFSAAHNDLDAISIFVVVYRIQRQFFFLKKKTSLLAVFSSIRNKSSSSSSSSSLSLSLLSSSSFFSSSSILSSFYRTIYSLRKFRHKRRKYFCCSRPFAFSCHSITCRYAIIIVAYQRNLLINKEKKLFCFDLI